MLKQIQPTYKLNLQLFGSDMFSSQAEGIENPIFSDTSDDVATTEDVVDTNDDPATEEAATDPVASLDNSHTHEQVPQYDFSDIKAKLDTILGRMDKSPQEVEEIEEKAAELTEEDIERMNNDFYLQFTEKPLEAIEKLIEERAERKIAPVMEYFEGVKKMEYWNGVLQDFEKAHPDFPDYVQDVSKIIQSDESIRNSKNPIELAYKVAKADKLESKVRPLDQQLKDEGVLKELLSNKEIKNLVVQALKSGGIETPKVIGSEGNTTVNVKEKPKTLSDATKAWLNI